MKPLTVSGMFSGIGGFTFAAERAGLRPLWECEIDPFARRVLSARWPGVTLYDDVRALDPALVERPDVLCAGFPCQDLSVAGKRAGLAGERSGLFWEIVRVAGVLRPDWLVLENVPGLLSSHGGRDMATVVGALADLGYLGAWRVLDAQWFGVAQRRRRVFLVGCAGEQRLAALLPFLASGNRHPAPRRTSREAIAGAPFHGPAGGGAELDMGVSPSLRAKPNDPHRADMAAYVPMAPAVAFSCKDYGTDAGAVAPTLRAMPHHGSHPNGGGQVAVAFQERGREGGRSLEIGGDVAYALTAPNGGGRRQEMNIAARSAVRRLTPTECERLQGFPDGHTCLCGRNRGRSVASEGGEPCRCADGSRYRALGNSVAVPCVEWILRRVREAESALPEPEPTPVPLAGPWLTPGALPRLDGPTRLRFRGVDGAELAGVGRVEGKRLRIEVDTQDGRRLRHPVPYEFTGELPQGLEVAG